jgi:hypothetical protein
MVDPLHKCSSSAIRILVAVAIDCQWHWQRLPVLLAQIVVVCL